MQAKRIGEMAGAFCTDEDGVTAIEYALLGALIFTVIVISVDLVGDAVVTLFERVAAEFS